MKPGPDVFLGDRSVRADGALAGADSLVRLEAGLIAASAVWLEPGRVLRPGWLRVQGGLVREAGSGDLPAHAADKVLRLPDLMLVPGFIDAHAHLGLGPADLLRERVAEAAGSGLAGLRDGGDREGLALGRRGEIEAEVRLSAAGQALFNSGRYGGFLGRAVSTREEIREAVLALARAGADQIKVLASGPVDLDEYGRVGPPQFEAAALAYLVAAAREQGLGVMAHANGSEAVLLAAQAGVVSVEHGYFMGPEALEALGEKGVVWVPTLVPLAALARDPATSSGRRGVIERTLEDQKERLAQARGWGVGLGLGTDAGSPGVRVGPSLRQEMALWLEAGFTAEEVLGAATAGGAALCGWQDLGRLTPGSVAVVVGLEADRLLEEALVAAPAIVGRPEPGGEGEAA
jgi:imidazolonepropionase-like amidohydrolase